jgi:hypothetical protein
MSLKEIKVIDVDKEFLEAKWVEAESFAAEHVRECAKELLEWYATGVLCGHRIAELSSMCRVGQLDRLCTYWKKYGYTALAEELVNRAALKAVSSLNDAGTV